jgi:hypothetical protein
MGAQDHQQLDAAKDAAGPGKFGYVGKRLNSPLSELADWIQAGLYKKTLFAVEAERD